MFYLNNKFVPIDVSRWKDKLNCVVNVGIGSGSQQTKMQTMSSIMTILGTLVQNGGLDTLVTNQNLYNAISEYIAQAGYKNTDQFVSNPSMMPPKQKTPTVEEQVKIQKAQIELQKLQLQTAELELDTKLKQQELELKKREAKVDFLIKQEELRIKQQKLEQGEMEIALEAVQERPVKIGND